MSIRLLHGDCREVLPALAGNSIDAVVTDPPYGLVQVTSMRADFPGKFGQRTSEQRAARSGFMGKQWDVGDVAHAVEFWAEVLRVLKPGGHVAAFGGTRTYHRMACAIEDAGFEVRDQLGWVYGSGFPKSLDVSKAIDKAAAGAEREVVAARPGVSKTFNVGADAVIKARDPITGPATDAARQWEGWGTALKPAWEPICLARKPLAEPTVAANVLRWGTGAINVDGCRIGAELPEGRTRHGGGIVGAGTSYELPDSRGAMPSGRWPANLCHDGSDEVLALFPESKSTGGRIGNAKGAFSGLGDTGFTTDHVRGDPGFGDTGSAARFFYTAKADADHRLGSRHPTVKPLDLMQWLVRLITPPGGTVLDPFAGTGTTGEAAWREGFEACLIEREAEYCADIERRIAHLMASGRERAETVVKARGRVEHPGPLFAEEAS